VCSCWCSSAAALQRSSVGDSKGVPKVRYLSRGIGRRMAAKVAVARRGQIRILKSMDRVRRYRVSAAA